MQQFLAHLLLLGNSSSDIETVYGRLDMEVTCHPRLGGASREGGGGTEIPVGRKLFLDQNLIRRISGAILYLVALMKRSHCARKYGTSTR